MHHRGIPAIRQHAAASSSQWPLRKYTPTRHAAVKPAANNTNFRTVAHLLYVFKKGAAEAAPFSVIYTLEET
jgi:hypothetical protein